MKLKPILAAALCTGALTCGAETLTVTDFTAYGPYPLRQPVMSDSTDVAGKALTDAAMAPAPEFLVLPSIRQGNAPADAQALSILAFSFDNRSYTEAEIEVEGDGVNTVYLDGVRLDGGNARLIPGTHSIAVRRVAKGNPAATVNVKSPGDAGLTLRTDGKRLYRLDDTLHGTRITGVTASPDGRFAAVSTSTTVRGGDVRHANRIISLPDGKTVSMAECYPVWTGTGSEYLSFVRGVNGTDIVAVDAATGARRTVASGLDPDKSYRLTPDGSRLLVTSTQEGRKEDPEIYRIIEPEDRQPGWRDRSAISVLDLATGIEQPVLFGNHDVYLQDISDDSQSVLVSVTRRRMEKRPTTLFDILAVNLNDLSVDTIASADGFVGSARFSPDGNTVIVQGNPEAFGGIGLNLPEGRIPNMTENELFAVDRRTGAVKPLTRDFDPSVERFQWSRADGRIWLTAEDRDCVSMFTLDPKTGKINKLEMPEDLASGFALPRAGRYAAWYGEGMAKPQSLYVMDTRNYKSTLVETPKGEDLADVKFGESDAWDFVNQRGDTICGRFYLPADFDPNKKYPMIVNYYGGCSPTSRNFESRYPHHAYAAQGYVVYVLQPSGATGFGQEFASRHVNTAGQGVAEDIIEGTKRFCEEHPYVDASRIGCIGASYGGFMTQYLQTVTDIFAAAVSHAGISDHTSYWGNGYWGYSYSEVSMANSYPWSDRKLYVDRSPLYNADKIHTPLLFVHGDSDVNVPFGESIQMFTALKLLGRPTAFVAVTGQDHHITDYSKRRKWQDTIFAWFARYLKDDPAWWDALYPGD